MAASWAPGRGRYPGLGKKAARRSLNVGTEEEEVADFKPGCLKKVGSITFCFCVEFGVTLLNKHLHYTLLVLENSTSAPQICEYEVYFCGISSLCCPYLLICNR